MHFSGSKALSLQEDDKCIFYYTVLKQWWMFLHSKVILTDTKKECKSSTKRWKIYLKSWIIWKKGEMKTIQSEN